MEFYLEGYDTALICKRGHLINSGMSKWPERNQKYCSKCGAEAISRCPNCNNEVNGTLWEEGYVTVLTQDEIPKYCHNCGKPYPWTSEKIKALEETIDLMDELTVSEKEEFKKEALDISNDNPRTSLAALKIKKFGLKTGKEVWGAAKEILIQIGSEAALKSMGLK